MSDNINKQIKSAAEKIEKPINQSGGQSEQLKPLEQEKAAFLARQKEKIVEDKLAKEQINDYLNASPASSIISQDKQRIKRIEKILEVDLLEIYLNLTPKKQSEFKLKGEETARQINDVLKLAKVKIKPIIDLIKKWLAIIPGINKYFLEQEAKIKADEIVKISQNINTHSQ